MPCFIARLCRTAVKCPFMCDLPSMAVRLIRIGYAETYDPLPSPDKGPDVARHRNCVEPLRNVTHGSICLDSHRDRGRYGCACQVPRRSIEPGSANIFRPRSGANRAVHVLDATDARGLPHGLRDCVRFGNALLRTAGSWVQCKHRMNTRSARSGLFRDSSRGGTQARKWSGGV